MAFSATALTVGSLVATAAGTGASIYASEKSSAAQQQTANYQAQVAKNNATLAGQNALTATQQADAQVQKEYTESTQQQSAARVAMAANGIQLDSGSALQVQGDIARTGQQNVQNAQYNSDANSVSFYDQALNDMSQSGLDTAEGEEDQQAGTIDAASDFISGASSVSSKWGTYLQNGTKGAQPAAAA